MFDVFLRLVEFVYSDVYLFMRESLILWGWVYTFERLGGRETKTI